MSQPIRLPRWTEFSTPELVAMRMAFLSTPEFALDDSEALQLLTEIIEELKARTDTQEAP